MLLSVFSPLFVVCSKTLIIEYSEGKEMPSNKHFNPLVSYDEQIQPSVNHDAFPIRIKLPLFLKASRS
jgi:hypothetical protein